MRVLRNLFAVGVFASFTMLAACGGAEDSPPGPLARHFDDMFIADVDTSLQQGVFDSQREWSKAKAENANAESDYNEASVQLTAVKNNRVFYVGDQWVETNGPIAREIVLREAAHYLYPDTFPKVDVRTEAAKLIPPEIQK